MRSTITRGTHNSRSIAAPQTIPASWEDAREQLITDGWPIDLGSLNPAGCLLIGTDLSPATLLSDDTAEIYGFHPDEFPNAVPDAILQIIASKLTGITGSLSQKIVMETGSYTGAGGASKEILFGIDAEIVIISYNFNIGIAVRGAERPFASNLNAAQRLEYAAWTDNSVVFSASSGASHFDDTHYQYRYVSIGRAA